MNYPLLFSKKAYFLIRFLRHLLMPQIAPMVKIPAEPSNSKGTGVAVKVPPESPPEALTVESTRDKLLGAADKEDSNTYPLGSIGVSGR